MIYNLLFDLMDDGEDGQIEDGLIIVVVIMNSSYVLEETIS